MKEVLASLLLSYSGLSSYHCKYELDEKTNGDKSSFGISDKPYFIVQHSSNVRITEIKATNGQAFYIREVTRNKSDYCLFTEIPVTNPPSISYLKDSSHSPLWLGNVGGVITIDKNTLEATITTGVLPCEALVSYTSKFYLYQLVPGTIVFPPNEDSYTIKVVIYLEDV